MRTLGISNKGNSRTKKRLGAASRPVIETIESRILLSATVAAWSFDQLTVTTTPNLSPAPSTGAGTALTVGMQPGSTNSNSPGGTYAYPNTNATGAADISDVLNGTGNNPTGNQADHSSTGATAPGNSTGVNPAWRIRGTSDGWSDAAAVASQGAQFMESTVGDSGISLTFDIDASSTSAPSEVAVQYTTNGGTSWLVAPSLSGGADSSNGNTDGISVVTNSTDPNTITGQYFQIANDADGLFWQNGLTADFSSISAANNNPNFGVRIVNAATGASEFEVGGTAYPAAGAGNWRLDNVTITATGGVLAAPSVSTQPVSVTTAAGQPVTFTSIASGNPTPSIQWQVSTNGGTSWANDTTDSGNTTNTLSFTASATAADNHDEYEAVFNNSQGTAASNPATLIDTLAAPVITTQPTAVSTTAGNTVTFVAAASGSPLPGVQWQSSPNGMSGWMNISGANSSTYTIPAASTSQNATYYEAVFTNSQGTATTNPVELTVSGVVLTGWNFNNLTSGQLTTSPTPSATAGLVNSGTASSLGMSGGPTVDLGTQTSGTFTLTVTDSSGAYTTTALAYNASASTVQTALDGLHSTTAAFTVTAVTTGFQIGFGTDTSAVLTGSGALLNKPSNFSVQSAPPYPTAGATGPDLSAGDTPDLGTSDIASISGESLTSNVATLTANNDFVVGNSVTVTGLAAPFNGTFTITAATATSFSYAATGSNVSSTPVTGSADGGSDWKLVGNNGWNTAAAIGSQGAQFLVPTTGFQNIGLTFDWGVSSAKANGQLAVEYTLNDSVATPVWVDAPSVSLGSNDSLTQVETNSTNANIINGSYFQNFNNGAWQDGLSANFSSVSGANNDPNFGVRIVNAATGAAVVGGEPAVVPTAASETGGAVSITEPATGFGAPLVGMSVTIAGITPAGFDGSYIITGVTGTGPYTVTYTDPNTGLGTATSLAGSTFIIGPSQTSANWRVDQVQITGSQIPVAPAITTQPTSAAVAAGSMATFTAAASGYPTPTVQWEVSTNGGTSWAPDTTDTGNTTNSLTVNASASPSNNGYEYEAIYTNSQGMATTGAATLTVLTAPVITTQPGPSSEYVNAGSVVTFTAAASGAPVPSVQWQVSTNGGTSWANDTTDTGVTTDSLSFTANENLTGNEYRAVFTNSSGFADSNAAGIVVVGTPLAQWVFTSGIAPGPDGGGEGNSSGDPLPPTLGSTSDGTYTLGLGGAGYIPNGGLGYTGVAMYSESDIIPTASGTNSNFQEFTWRLRSGDGLGNTGTPGTPEGWSQNAPEYAQGVQFDVNTTGYSNLTLHFDLQDGGVTNIQPLYSTDGGSTWTPVPNGLFTFSGAGDYYGINGAITAASSNGTTDTVTATGVYQVGESVTIAGMTPSGYNGTYTITGVGNGTFSYTNTVSNLAAATGFGNYIASAPVGVTMNLQGLPGVANNPNFELQLAAAYNPALPNIIDGNTNDGAYNAPHGQYSTGIAGPVDAVQNLQFGTDQNYGVTGMDSGADSDVTGGTFTLTYGTQTTAPITFSSTASTLISNITGALETLTGLTATATATKATSTASALTITAPGTFTVGETVTLAGFTSSAYNGTFTVASVVSGGFTIASTSNPGTATVLGTVNSPNFAVTQTNYNSSGVLLQPVRDGLGNIDTDMSITFKGALADAAVTTLTANGSGLTGGNPSATVATWVNGSTLGYEPYVDGGGDWLLGNISFNGDSSAAGGLAVQTSPLSTTVAAYAGENIATFTSTAYSEEATTSAWQYSNNNGSSWNSVPSTFTVASTAATSTASALTITAPGTYAVGESVTLAGFTPSAYNGTYTIASVVSGGFTIASAANPGAATGSGLGSVTASSVVTTQSGSVYTSTLTVVADLNMDQSGDLYEAVFSDAGGSAVSNPATLTVVAPFAPIVTLQPTNAAALAGSTTTSGAVTGLTGAAVFTVAATGSPTPSVQWQISSNGGMSWSNVVNGTNNTNGNGGTYGANTDTLVYFTNANGSENGDLIRAMLSNAISVTYSNPVTLTVLTNETDVSEWQFNATNTFTVNPPTTGGTIGTGSALTVGMDVPYNVNDAASGLSTNGGGAGAVPASLVKVENGQLNPSFTETVYDVVGGVPSTNGGIPAHGNPANGWSLLVPQNTQGLQISVPTTGYNNVYVSMNWYSTHSAELDAQEQYTVGGTTVAITSASSSNVTPSEAPFSNPNYSPYPSDSGYQGGATVSNDIATLSAPNSFKFGDEVTVTGLPAPYDGTFQVVWATANNFSYYTPTLGSSWSGTGSAYVPTWINLGNPIQNNTTPSGNDDFYGASIAAVPAPVIFNLTGITGVNNNPNFGIRLVNAYDPYLSNTQGLELGDNSNFTLNFNGQTTGTISYSSNGTTLASNIQAALSALSTVGAGNVTVTDGGTLNGQTEALPPNSYEITFDGALAVAAQPPVVANDVYDFVQTNYQYANATYVGSPAEPPPYNGSKGNWQFGNIQVHGSPITTFTDNGPNASNVGQAVSFTATVEGGVPDGETVNIEDASNGNAIVAAATLSGGTATFSDTTLSAGTHDLFAVYVGDANYNSSQSSQVVQVVNSVSATPPTLSSSLINGSTSTQRSVVSSIALTFSEPVNFSSGSFTLYSEPLVLDTSGDANNGNYVINTSASATDVSSQVTASNPSGDGMNWILTVTGGTAPHSSGTSLSNGIYQLVLHGANISGTTGGGQYNGGSDQIVQFNSVEAGGMSNYFHVLYGDIAGSGIVNLNDYRAFKAAYLSSDNDNGMVDSNWNPAFDLGNGPSDTINLNDYRAFTADYLVGYSY